MLYAGTPTGLYKCDISNLDAVQWEKLPITDDIIEDFEIRGDTVIVLSRKGLLLSVDGGMTVEQIMYTNGKWQYPVASIYDVTYDTRNPNTLYGANMYTGLELDTDTMKVIRSTDGGLTWSEFFAEPMANKGLLRMDIKDNLLALYTSANGIYLLDVDAVETSISAIKDGPSAITPYYDLQGRKVANPTRGIYIKDGKKIAVD